MFEVWGTICLLTTLSVGFAFLSTQFVLPFCIQNARRWGTLDRPNSRKVHTFPTPRLGGVGVAPAIWFSAALTLIALDKLGPQLDFFSGFPVMITGLLIGVGGMFVIGILDDLKSLAATRKLIAQAIVAAVVLAFLPIPSSILGFDIHPSLALFLMFSWLVIVPNSVNLMDGVDGLTSSMLLVFLFSSSVVAALTGQALWMMICIPTAAAVIGFLRFNWSPARIFLGDSGSLSLGFVVAYLSLGLAIQNPGQGGSSNWSIWLSLLLVSIWLMDTSLAIARRYISRAPKLKLFLKRSKAMYFMFQWDAIRGVMRPDCKHIHHLVLRMGFDAKSTALLIASLLFATHGLAFSIWLGFRFETENFVLSNLLTTSVAASSLAVLFVVGRQILGKRSHRSNVIQSYPHTTDEAQRVVNG